MEKKTHLQNYFAKKLFGKNPLQRTYFALEKSLGKKLYEKTSCKEITSFQKYFRTQNLWQKFIEKKLFECTLENK